MEKVIETVKEERRAITDFYDREVYDFNTFKDCQSSLDALRSQISDVYECKISDFGEALANSSAKAEKKALEKAYNKLHDRLYPIMKETYKGYKAHSEWCRIGYTYIEEFEIEDEDEDDIYHLLGLD